MRITRVEPENGKKYRIYVDEEYVFSLYNKELKQFDIQEDNEISKDTITYIIDTVIYKRAKERALFLLERKPLSIHMMRNQLQNNGYPLDVIERVILFLIKYHYLDDDEYTKMYVNSYSGRKSKKQLVYELYRRGIPRSVIDDYFHRNDYSEQNCFNRQFYQYINGKDLLDYKVRQKVFHYFYRKGFSTSLIEGYIKDYMNEIDL